MQCKFPEDMKLAGKSIDEIEELPIHLQLKCLRLHAVHTIVEAAQKAVVSRWTLMNYEKGRTTRVKRRIVELIMSVYATSEPEVEY